MNNNKTNGRQAGILYLMVVFTGIFGLLYVPSKLIAYDDPTLTVSNIMSSDLLFRAGTISELLCQVLFLLLPLALYKLLEKTNRDIAIIMVVLAVVSVPISFIAISHKLDILDLLSGAEHYSVFNMAELEAQVMLALNQYGNGIQVAQVFWGLWLFPYGYLTFKSGFLPKTLGVFLMIGSAGYFGDFLGQSLFANYHEMAVAKFITIPASIGEIGSALWLAIAGAKENIKY